MNDAWNHLPPDRTPPRNDAQIPPTGALDRRALLRGGLVLGAGLALGGLAGCQGNRSKAVGPVWPDQEPTGVDTSVPGGVQNARPYIAPPPPTSPQDLDRVAIPTGVIPRSRWTSSRTLLRTGDRDRGADPMGYIGMITVHHDAVNAVGVTSMSAAARRLETIRGSHVRGGWADIGYHYIIDPTGRVWQGRPVNFQGAHVKDHNPHNLGVMCMGNFSEHRPTPEQLAALDAFVAGQMRVYRVPIQRVFTHRELMPTACPGTNLQRYMLATRGRSGRLAVGMA